MKIHNFISKNTFDKLYDCDNQPEMDEAKSCMYCAHRETLHLDSDFSYSFPKQCCSKFMFEICEWNVWRWVCDDFKERE